MKAVNLHMSVLIMKPTEPKYIRRHKTFQFYSEDLRFFSVYVYQESGFSITKNATLSTNIESNICFWFNWLDYM